MIAKLIGEVIAAAIKGVLQVLAASGVSEADIEAGKLDALRQISDIKCSEVAAHARQWKIAQGLEP